MRNENETREYLIDPMLRRAGWSVLTTKHLIEKNKACIEVKVTGMPITSDNHSGVGFVDYVLFGNDGKPLALIEAKKSVVNEEIGRVQACLYADCLEHEYGIRPVIYYTNGYSIKVIDGIYPARQVFGFHMKDEIEYIIQKRKYTLKDKTVNAEICGRYYQIDAINEVLQHIEKKNSRSLIVLATGTGKTRVSCGISEIFLKNNFVKRILFLADQRNLVSQAKEDTFEKFLPNYPMSIIMGGVRESKESQARIVFSTYQSMLSIIKDLDKCPYGIGHFDLIIVDEAHRSLFNKYAEIFEYFDSLMIGLTATPRDDIHKSTYQVFNLDVDSPNYEYDLVKAVKDGYLTYFRALDRTPDILKNGLKYDDLSDEEKEQYELLFTDEDDGTLPEKIENELFYSVIMNKDTIRQVLKDLMEEGLKVNNGDILGKTIIFARNIEHANLIQDEFRKMYPELCNPHGEKGIDYCVVIANKVTYNEVLQREFKTGQRIRIVVSVDMMDTGVDVPDVVNLVFFKRVASKIKFWQMIGRGTRPCDSLNIISPSKSYFERLTNDSTRQLYKSKQGFMIFDICNTFPFFKQNPDGKKDGTNSTLSLYQKIFMEKVNLIRVLSNNCDKLNEDDMRFLDELKQSINKEIAGLNRNFIGVQSNIEFVEKYSDETKWNHIQQNDIKDIKEHIAPNVTGEIDLNSARVFDYLCYKFSSTKFTSESEFKKTAKLIYSLTMYLVQNKMHITEVKEHKETLEYIAITTDKFISETGPSVMNKIREEIRELTKYIEVEHIEPIISDFIDKISSFNDADEDYVDFSINVDDFKTLEEKIKFYIANNSVELVNEIRNLRKPSLEAITAFHGIMESFSDAEEINATFMNDDELISFIRRNVSINDEALQEFYKKFVTFNDFQNEYIVNLMNYIFQNGSFKRGDLLKEELNFNGIFNSAEIQYVISNIENVI